MKSEESINPNNIVAYTVTGKHLTKTEYIRRLDDAKNEIKEGNCYSHVEVKKIIKSWF